MHPSSASACVPLLHFRMKMCSYDTGTCAHRRPRSLRHELHDLRPAHVPRVAHRLPLPCVLRLPLLHIVRLTRPRCRHTNPHIARADRRVRARRERARLRARVPLRARRRAQPAPRARGGICVDERARPPDVDGARRARPAGLHAPHARERGRAARAPRRPGRHAVGHGGAGAHGRACRVLVRAALCVPSHFDLSARG
jgi:hypothetical protein